MHAERTSGDTRRGERLGGRCVTRPQEAPKSDPHGRVSARWARCAAAPKWDGGSSHPPPRVGLCGRADGRDIARPVGAVNRRRGDASAGGRAPWRPSRFAAVLARPRGTSVEPATGARPTAPTPVASPPNDAASGSARRATARPLTPRPTPATDASPTAQASAPSQVSRARLPLRPGRSPPSPSSSSPPLAAHCHLLDDARGPCSAGRPHTTLHPGLLGPMRSMRRTVALARGTPRSAALLETASSRPTLCTRALRSSVRQVRRDPLRRRRRQDSPPPLRRAVARRDHRGPARVSPRCGAPRARPRLAATLHPQAPVAPGALQGLHPYHPAAVPHPARHAGLPDDP